MRSSRRILRSMHRRAFFLLVLVAVLLFSRFANALGPRVVESTLSNGTRLFVSEQRNVPMLLVQVVVDAGARWDPPGREGVAYLTADLLNEGTTTRSAAEISEATDFLGASLTSSVEMDYAVLNLRVLARDADTGLDLLSDVILHPTFPEVELARRREALLAAIRADEDNPTAVASKTFRRTLFAGEPYGHPPEGSESSVARIRRAEVQKFHAAHYRPRGSLIVVVGDTTAEEIRARLERVLSAWKGEAPAPFQYPAPGTAARTPVHVEKPVTQAAIVLGHRGITRDNPDFEALAVMNYVLGGGGFSSRLMSSIRTEAGLAYSVGSYFTSSKFPGSFQVIMQTKNESVGEAIRRARAEVERIRSEPVSDEELDEAKRYLTGSYALRMDSNSEIAQLIAEYAFYGLGLDYADTFMRKISAVTKEEVQRVAREYLHPDQLLEVIVADHSRAGAGPARASH